jgi:hypothetical protein
MALQHREGCYAALSVACCLGTVCFTVLSCGRIVSNAFSYTQVYDEPFHITRGYLWIMGERYQHALHPPLGPIAFAAGPILYGVRINPSGDRLRDGNEILHSGNYHRNLGIARLGNILFFLWATIAVWGLARLCHETAVAYLSTCVFVVQPMVVSHASLATTDAPVMATLCLFVAAMVYWCQNPTYWRGAGLGACGGLTILAKFSGVVFIPACIGGILLSLVLDTAWTALRKQLIGSSIVACVVGAYVVWMGYGFSIGAVDVSRNSVIESLTDRWPLLEKVARGSVPAPELWEGLALLAAKNSAGHAPYFFGQERGASIAFFPTVLAIKTPICLVLLFLSGAWHSIRSKREWRQRVPMYCVCAVVLVGMFSHINLGVRHMLPAYPFICIVAADAAVWLWRTSHCVCAANKDGSTIVSGVRRLWLAPIVSVLRPRTLVVLLWLGGLTEAFVGHSRFIAWFNPLAGRHPEWIVVDSDLDWGQDLGSLSAELRRRGSRDIFLAYFGTADVARHGLPTIHHLDPGRRVNGVIAISITLLQSDEGYAWLKEYDPIGIVGASIHLYDTSSVEVNGS